VEPGSQTVLQISDHLHHRVGL